MGAVSEPLSSGFIRSGRTVAGHHVTPKHRALAVALLLFATAAADWPTADRVLATPEAIWAQLMTPGPIRAEEIEDSWMYRIGAPVPESAVSEVGPEQIVRHIRMGKGIHFDQFAVEWEPNRSVRWQYRFARDSFPSGALDDHVRIGGDYFDILDTTYALEPTPDGTLLHASMTYRVSTRFNWYAEPIAALLVGNFEEAALRFYGTRAERPPPRG